MMGYYINNVCYGPASEKWVQGIEIAQWARQFERNLIGSKEVCRLIQEEFYKKAEEINNFYSHGKKVKARAFMEGSSYIAEILTATNGRGSLVVSVTMRTFRSMRVIGEKGGMVEI